MQWKRVFSRGEGGPAGPRRRETERYDVALKLAAKATSWSRFHQLMSSDVSAGGFFVPTDQTAAVGEKIELEVTLPDGTLLPMIGTIVTVISAEQGARLGKAQGLGIRLDPPSGDSGKKFDQAVKEVADSARGSATRPAVSKDHPVPRPAEPPMDPIIGIDLGTTYTSVSVTAGRRVVMAPFPGGFLAIPSAVWFPQPGHVLCGAEARAHGIQDPEHIVFSPKRLLGRRFGEADVDKVLSHVPWRAHAAPDGTVLAEMWGQAWDMSQICAYILAEARQAAEMALGSRVGRAVLSVPVTFDANRVGLLKRAAQLAHLEVVAVLDEPSAAALAHRYTPSFGGVVGIYDFGGGTFDFTVVDVSRGDFSILATAGDSWLGGDDLDLALAETVAGRVLQMRNVDLRRDRAEWQRLILCSEIAKRELSSVDETRIDLTQELRLRVDRGLFERACEKVVQRSIITCHEVLDLIGLLPANLSGIYLSGGTTYVPAVRKALQRAFGVPIRAGVPPEHAVCLGAGIHAAQMMAAARTTVH